MFQRLSRVEHRRPWVDPLDNQVRQLKRKRIDALWARNNGRERRPRGKPLTMADA
jgi:hypothetical protein